MGLGAIGTGGFLLFGEKDTEGAKGSASGAPAKLAPAEADPAARAAALNNLALVLRKQGELDRALDLTDEALALCRTVGDRHREAALTNNAADLLHAAGRREEAMARLRSAVGIFAEIGDAGAMQPEIWKLVEW